MRLISTWLAYAVVVLVLLAVGWREASRADADEREEWRKRHR